jgi:hypothetical protein
MGHKGWLLAWAATLPVVLARAGVLHESDTFWQIRTGELILSAHRLPAVDTFSWTASGRPWQLNSWGFDVAVALAYRLGGLPAVAVLSALLGFGALGAVVLLAQRLGASAPATGFAAVGTAAALIDWLDGRPQLVDYAAVPLLFVLLLRWRSRPGGSVAVGIFALHVAWVNLHSAATLGVAACAVALPWLRPAVATAPASAAPAPAAPARRAVPGWLAAAVPALLAALGVLVNPHGAGLLRQSATVHRESAGVIQEWLPPDPTHPAQLVPLLIAAAGLAWTIARRQWLVAVPLLGLTVAGLVALRFGPIAALVGAAAAAAALSTDRVRTWAAGRRTILTGGAVAAVLGLSTLAGPALTDLGRPEVPARTLAALPAGCHLLNEYILGGHVILRRPDVPVSLDSRNDLYGAAEVRRLQGAFDRPRPELLDELGITCVLTRKDRKLAALLRADPGWRRAADDGAVEVYVRTA